MLYQMNNTFRNTDFKISVDAPLTRTFASFSFVSDLNEMNSTWRVILLDVHYIFVWIIVGYKFNRIEKYWLRVNQQTMKEKTAQIVISELVKVIFEFIRWWMENVYRPCKRMEYSRLTAESHILRIHESLRKIQRGKNLRQTASPWRLSSLTWQQICDEQPEKIWCSSFLWYSNFRSHVATSSQAIAEEEQMTDKISSPGLVKKHSTHVQGLAILFSFRKYASYVMKYALWK